MKIYLFRQLLIAFFLLINASVFAQTTVKGLVLETNEKGEFLPLVGATVHWLGTTVGAVSDTNGVFQVKTSELSNKLIISFIGYKADTILVKNPDLIRVVLQQHGVLSEVNVEFVRNSTYISAIEPIKTQMMSEKELFKAACCNLSESFETNPSVDVAFSDAVSGAKQIQMLGLSGIYTQLTNENLPATRGLASAYGLSYTPGSWIEGIQVTKGIGSVANGFESIAGQINVELRKPEKTDKLFFNAFLNEMGRTEANLNVSQKIGKRWATGLLLHGNYLDNTVRGQLDMNKDGFRDIPAGKQLNAVNRWKYDDGKGLMLQLGVRALDDIRQGGQLSYNHKKNNTNNSAYGVHIATQRQEVFGKLGYVFPAKKYKSIGLMATVVNHNQNSFFGLTQYDAKQQSMYANLIYQSVINNTNHKYRVGASVMADRYREKLNSLHENRNENVSGIFGEYTYSYLPRFTLVAGLRADYNNLFGWFATPRLHLKYDLTDKTILRASYGRGQRTANIFAENTSLLVSNRALQILPTAGGKAYNLKQEIAWNGGLSLTHDFRLWYKSGSFNIDYFRTDFQNQVIADVDASAQGISFYNLRGKSYSNSVQAEVNYQPIKRLDVKIAYRWLDVKTDYLQGRLEKALIARHRTFVNLGYETRNHWKFDLTAQVWGSKRLPNTENNPAAYQIGKRSPVFTQFNAQISKAFGKHLEVYVGGENLSNYRQKNLIVAVSNPSSPYFDASMVWGPVIGRMLYTGLRYRFS